jgi:endonuclease/exonuclease/phosphatase family metal-dependent hydrolase
MKRLFVFFLALCLCGCSADLQGLDPETFKVLSYNVQNLMDATLDGTEYPEYRPSEDWTEENYLLRLKTLSTVLVSRTIGMCDVLVLQEVENGTVVSDLLHRHLARRGYCWYATASDTDGPISLAIVSVTKPREVYVHGVPGARPVLEAVFDTASGPVTIFALHAKSQIGDPEETEALRIETARTIGGALARKDEEGTVLLCGDFNEDPTSFAEGDGSQTALVPVTERRFIDAGSLGVTGDRELVYADTWYCPYLDPSTTLSVPGSCHFSGQWHRYDQILGNGSLFDRKGWEYDSFAVAAPSPCSNPDGTPASWNLATKNGVSDHYPVLLTLRSSP